MRLNVLAAGLLSVGTVVDASAQSDDSMRVVRLGVVNVTSTRVDEKSPVAHSRMGSEEIEKVNSGVDMPFILLATPSVVATSDAGTGIGYTGLRIRGSDPSRINVTMNGIPVNDAESSTAFWVNLPDLASGIDDVQVQRGVGTSTNGAGAFGGSINIRTDGFRGAPYTEMFGSFGSFGTQKETLKFGTGLLGGRFAFDARLSNIQSDGYVDRASTALNSYFLQAGYYGHKTTVRLLHFTGREKTYHAWDGLDRQTMERDRRYNPCGEIYDDAGNLTGYYKDQTDNYLLKNLHLLFFRQLSQKLTLSFNLHYTDGYGYYQEYKNRQRLSDYDLEGFEHGGQTVTSSNLVRRKIMDNWFGGAVFSLDYRADNLQVSLGGAANRYDGDHIGNVIWVRNYVGPLSPRHEYYRNRGLKDDMNIYLKANRTLLPNLNLYLDAQYRRVEHSMHGISDRRGDENSQPRELNVDAHYNFFNPKAGLRYSAGRHNSLFVLFAVAGKEPRRDDFKYMEPGTPPKSERLYDYEAGWSYSNRHLALGVNVYYMYYMNQLVQTGQRNDIGEALSKNMAESYRTGVELTFSIELLRTLSWSGNVTLSRNKIKNYTDHVDNYDTGVAFEEHFEEATIAYSPSITAGSLLSFSSRGWAAALQSNYVWRQFMNNSMAREVELREYFVNNLRLSRTFKPSSMRSLTIGVAVNNVFNARYCSNGFAGRYIENGQMESWAVYFPQATTNILVNLTLKF